MVLGTIAQMLLWQRDRKKLSVWREQGFFCERLEFLPANRVRINNLELEVNAKQLQTLKLLAIQRLQSSEPMHSLDVDEFGNQAIKRLREELGTKFLEKVFIKVRKGKGYWLEVEPKNIRGISPPQDERNEREKPPA